MFVVVCLPALLFAFKKLFVFVCCLFVGEGVCTEVRGQLLGVFSVLSSCGFIRLGNVNQGTVEPLSQTTLWVGRKVCLGEIQNC